MKNNYLFVLLVLAFTNSFAQSSCVNLDFEQQNFGGWTGKYNITSAGICGQTTPNPLTNTGFSFTTINNTGDEHGIVTGGYDVIVPGDTLFHVCPYGGLASCRLGDANPGCGASFLSQTFTVGLPDTLFTVYYGVVLWNGHPIADSPLFSYKLKTSNGTVIDSVTLTEYDLAPKIWLDWTGRTTSLAAYVGQNITVEFISSDCDGGSHLGYAYIDCSFGNCSNTSGLSETEEDIKLYPNPANTSIRIENHTDPLQEVSMMDILGNSLMKKEQSIGNSIIFNTTNLANGIYFVNIKTSRGIVTRKIIVRH